MLRPEFLINHRIPIWVLITGNVRSGREFRRVFKQVVDLRQRGLVDGIRLATWKGELEQVPGLEQALTDAGISILTIEAPPVDPKMHPLFHGYIYHQRKALHFALKSLPSNSFVLKTRTDFSEERFESMVAALFGNPSLKLDVDISSPILQTRLFSYDARPDYLFYWDDIVFSGMRDDLLEFNNFDIACEFIHPGHLSPPESRLFAPLFLKRYPILQWFFENIHGEEFARLLQRWVASDGQLPLPVLVRDVLASYFHILSRYVVLPDGGRGSDDPICLQSFFSPNQDLGVKTFSHPWASHKLFSQCLLDRLRGPGDFADGNLAALVAAMRRMDLDVECRGALPPDFGECLRAFDDFSRHFGCESLVEQARLIPAAQTLPNHPGNLLDEVEMPEKRHLSWWQQKKLGARRTAASWLLRKLL